MSTAIYKMASKEAQAKWRERKAQGLIQYCTCGRRLRAESARSLCQTCWRKTEEGREYLRQKKREGRTKQSPPLLAGIS